MSSYADDSSSEEATAEAEANVESEPESMDGDSLSDVHGSEVAEEPETDQEQDNQGPSGTKRPGPPSQSIV